MGTVKSAAFYRDSALPFLEVKLCSDRSLSYKRHFHEEYSLGIVDEGSSTVWCNGIDLTVEADRFIWIPPYVPHACNPDESSGWSYRMLFLHSGWVEHVWGGGLGILNAPLLPDNRSNRKLKRLLDQLICGLKNEVPPLETEAVLLEMMASLGNTVPEGSNSLQPRPTLAGHAEATVLPASLLRAKEYLHGHYLERITMEELEAVSGISRYHLIHRFTSAYHLPPHAYQNLLRFQFAKKELDRKRPIAEVAVEAGFYDQSHFTKMFKGFAGVTPYQYAKSR